MCQEGNLTKLKKPKSHNYLKPFDQKHSFLFPTLNSTIQAVAPFDQKHSFLWFFVAGPKHDFPHKFPWFHD